MCESLLLVPMDQSESQRFSVEVEDRKRNKSGFYIKKTAAIFILIGAVILIVLVGVIAAYLGPGKHGRKNHPQDQSKRGW